MVEICGTFPTPWVNHVYLRCACGAGFCVPASRRWVECRRCDAGVSMMRLLEAVARTGHPDGGPAAPPDEDAVPPALDGWVAREG